MLQTKTYEIKSTDDIELNIKRDSLLEFKVSFDDEKEMKALFFFIPGCGMDALNDSYAEHIAEFVVKEFEVAVIRVNYHCIGNRPDIGAKLYFSEIDKIIMQRICQSIGINIPDLDKKGNFLCDNIESEIKKLKDSGLIPKEAFLYLTGSLKPAKNEYQNFGVMQAIDILNALCFVKKNTAFKLVKDYKTLLFGSSHGGYLALLCAKFAPWLIDAVVESSSYVETCEEYMGYVKKFNAKFVEADARNEHLCIILSTKTLWTLDKNSPNYFSPAHNKIRSLVDEEHLKIRASHNKPKITSYHSIKDNLALPHRKEELHHKLKNLNYDSTLYMLDEKDVDGKFIKNIEFHGMNMSLKTLIQKELPPLLERKFKHDKKEKREIIYPSENLEYHFKERARGGGIELMIKRLD